MLNRLFYDAVSISTLVFKWYKNCLISDLCLYLRLYYFVPNCWRDEGGGVGKFRWTWGVFFAKFGICLPPFNEAQRRKWEKLMLFKFNSLLLFEQNVEGSLGRPYCLRPNSLLPLNNRMEKVKTRQKKVGLDNR